jgi:hypothetical protein
MHGDVFGDLLKTAEVICKKTAANFSVGDEVEARLSGGTSYKGVVEEIFPDDTANVPLPNGRPRKVPFTALKSLADVDAQKVERKQRDDAEAREAEEEARLQAEEARQLGEETARQKAFTRATQKFETATVYYDANASEVDKFAEWLKVNGGHVRVHYSPRVADLADWMFQQVGIANTLQPYTPGSHGGDPEGMRAVQGVVMFPMPPNFRESDVPVEPNVKITPLGNKVEVNNTAFAFQMIERGVRFHS